MNFKDFLTTFDTYLEYENLFSSHYYGYVNNVFVEKKLLYPILIYHTDAMNHTILDNSITVLKFNFFVFDKLKTDNSNVIDVQDDLLKKLVKIKSYLKRNFLATNFNITAISDEAYSEKITGWVMNCEIKLDTSDESCGYVMYPRFLEDGICRYDRFEHKIVECLLPDGTEINFPDYTYFLGNEMFPVYEIEPLIFRNMNFIGDFKMNNLKIVGDRAFEMSKFNGILEAKKVKEIGYKAFRYSKFSKIQNLNECNVVSRQAFEDNNVIIENLTMLNCKMFNEYSFKNVIKGYLNIPNCKNIFLASFQNSNFNKITIGANATLEANCIGAHSAEFIRDYADNGKLAGTYVWDEDTQHWIYQN